MEEGQSLQGWSLRQQRFSNAYLYLIFIFSRMKIVTNINDNQWWFDFPMVKWEDGGAPAIICRIKNPYLIPSSPILHYLSLSLSCFTLSYFIFSLWNLAHVSHQQQVIINLPCPIQRLSVPLSICLFFSYFILSHFIFSHFIIVKPGLSAASRSGTSPRSTCSLAGKPSQKGRRLSIRF